MTLSGVFSGSGWPPVSFYVVLLLLSSILSSYFLDLPIYLPLHEQSKWYTVGWILGSIFGLFWHRILYKFLAGVKVMLLLTFLKFVSNFFSNIRCKGDFLLVGVIVTAIFSELIKREAKLEIHLTTCWLPPKNALSNQKFSFEWLPITYVELFFKIVSLFLKNQNIFVDKPHTEINYSELSVRLKLFGLLHMRKTRAWSRAWHSKFQQGPFFVHAVNFSGNLTPEVFLKRDGIHIECEFCALM